MLKIHVVGSCILFSLLTSFVRAQMPEDYVSISLQTISWQGVIKDVYYMSSDGESQIFSPNASFSKTQRYVGPKSLQFYRKQKTEEGVTQIPIAVASFPPAARGHYIFVFIEDEQSAEERYRLYPIAYDSKMGQPNQMTLVNLSSNKMVGRIDDSKFELNAGSLHTVDVHPNSGGQCFGAIFIRN